MQIIKRTKEQNASKYTQTTIEKPRSLDDFQINILSLNDEKIWERDNNDLINDIEDIKSIGDMIDHSNAVIIIVLPQNLESKYAYRMDAFGNSKFTQYEKIKDNICLLKNTIKHLCQVDDFHIRFEPTETKIGDNDIKSDFCFDNINNFVIKTKSTKSQKITTIQQDNIVITTLDLDKENRYEDFIDALGFLQSKCKYPDWFENFKFFDDESQIKVIEEEQQHIIESNKKIADANVIIERNNHYKSIVYTNSKELEEVCCEIIDEMLGTNTTCFEDVHKEDFSAVLGEYVLIGEIKGVGHNVQNSMLSQIEYHRDGYLERNDAIDGDKIRSLLIVNHNRNLPLDEREEVNIQQINKAENKNILIIETITLLKLYEKYKNDEVTKDEIIDMIINNKGLLSV